MKLSKELSANDLGLTGGHQAGIHIPKSQEFLDFFPDLAADTKNPRRSLHVEERDTGVQRTFSFIYYNNRFFGGTRNEFRLTGMTEYLRNSGAQVGDTIVFERESEDYYTAWIEAKIGEVEPQGEFVIVLSGKWKLFNSSDSV